MIGWDEVNVILHAIGLAGSVGVWAWGLASIRDVRDPLRKPFAEARSAALVLAVALLFAIIGLGLGLGDDPYAGSQSDQTISHIGNIAALWNHLSDAVAVTAFGLLALAISRLQGAGAPVKRASRLSPTARKWLVYAGTGVVTVLAIACFGLAVALINGGGRSAYDVAMMVRSLARLELALFAVVLAGNVGLLVVSVRLAVRARTSRAPSTAAHYLLGSLTIWLVRTVFHVVDCAMYSPLDTYDVYRAYWSPEWHQYVLSPILGDWPLVLAFALAVALGTKSYSGLWSSRMTDLESGGVGTYGHGHQGLY